MKRLATTRSEWPARQLSAGRAQWRVGSIEADGTRYGLATSTLTARTTTTARTMESVQSRTPLHGSGTRLVRRSTGFVTPTHSSGEPAPGTAPFLHGPHARTDRKRRPGRGSRLGAPLRARAADRGGDGRRLRDRRPSPRS